MTTDYELFDPFDELGHNEPEKETLCKGCRNTVDDNVVYCEACVAAMDVSGASRCMFCNQPLDTAHGQLNAHDECAHAELDDRFDGQHH